MIDGKVTSKGSPGSKNDFQIRSRINRVKDARLAGLFDQEEEWGDRRRPIMQAYSKQKSNRNEQTSIFRHDVNFPIVSSPTALSDYAIKNSKLYRMLEYQIASCLARHSEYMYNLTNQLELRYKYLDQYSKELHDERIQIWEMKNEIIKLQSNLERYEEYHSYLSGYGAPSEYDQYEYHPYYRSEMTEEYKEPTASYMIQRSYSEMSSQTIFYHVGSSYAYENPERMENGKHDNHRLS